MDNGASSYRRFRENGDDRGLDEIIIDFNGNVDSRRLPREFGYYRTECGKRCIKGSNCNLCRAMRGFAERMEKTDTIIKPAAKD